MADDYGARVNYKTQKEIYLEKIFTGRIDRTPDSVQAQTRFYRTKR
jgi:hypothetical protein